MKTRIVTAIGILAFVIPALLYGSWLLFALIACIVILGGIEYLNLSENHKNWPMYIKPIIIASTFFFILLDENIAIAVLGACSLLYLSFSVFTEKFEPTDAFLAISCNTLFYMIATSFLRIHESNAMYVWYIIIATYCCDTAAYFCGRFFGKHKLNERVSPKKTWEGSIGGWIFGAICSYAFAYFCIDNANTTLLLLGSCILPITGQIGDLAFSAIKRHYKIKDFSNLLPGHGGVLDRIDSLVFNFICFNLILVVIL